MKEEKDTKEGKYIICDCAEADWGKTSTLNKVIDELEKKIGVKITCHYYSSTRRKDRWCSITWNKKIYISTLGDPGDYEQSIKHIRTNAPDIVVIACRPCDSTQSQLCKCAQDNGYEIIWFKNFHCDCHCSSRTPLPNYMEKVQNAEATAIVNVIEQLIFL